ncbi:hypothetical protein BDV09DRAFT_41470 [Aspergillus tetrazonus]
MRSSRRSTNRWRGLKARSMERKSSHCHVTLSSTITFWISSYPYLEYMSSNISVNEGIQFSCSKIKQDTEPPSLPKWDACAVFDNRDSILSPVSFPRCVRNFI